MTQEFGAPGFLASFGGIFEFFDTWLGELLARFDDRTALLRPAADVNHALWLLGHITWVVDGLLVEVPTGESFRNQEWDRFFKIGCERFPDGEYPPFSDVRSRYEEVSARVKARLEGMKPEDLSKPCMNGGDWFPMPVDAMLHFIRDADYHLGQLSLVDKLIDR